MYNNGIMAFIKKKKRVGVIISHTPLYASILSLQRRMKSNYGLLLIGSQLNNCIWGEITHSPVINSCFIIKTHFSCSVTLAVQNMVKVSVALNITVE